MRKEMRLIDADKAIESLNKICNDKSKCLFLSPDHECDWCRVDFAKSFIMADEFTPTVDAVQVVRCKDCKFNLANIEDIQNNVNINEGWNACSLTELYDSVCPDDYCSKGKRIEEKDDNA